MRGDCEKLARNMAKGSEWVSRRPVSEVQESRRWRLAVRSRGEALTADSLEESSPGGVRSGFCRESEVNRKMNFADKWFRIGFAASLVVALLFAMQPAAGAQSTGVPSATPPMGWNSWGSYGTTVNAGQV